MKTLSLIEASAIAPRLHGQGDMARDLHKINVALSDMARTLVRFPLAAVAVAMDEAPDTDAGTALAELADRLESLSTAMADSYAAMREQHRLERDDLKGVVAEAFARNAELSREIDRLEREMQHGIRKTEEKREQLEKAGLTREQIDTLAPPFDPIEITARQEILTAEREAICRFFKSHNPADLPQAA